MANLDLSEIITRICTDLSYRFAPITSVKNASSVLPVMDGTAYRGTDRGYACGDHRHPTDTSRQEKLVSGTNIKTINGNSLLGSGDLTIGGGGGGVNKLTLYTDSGFTNLWVDSARTTTLMESYEYSYNTAKTDFSSKDIIEIWDSRLEKKFTVVRWDIDPVDETFDIDIIRGVNGTTVIGHRFGIYE